MHTLWQDIRFAVRMLLKNWSVTAIIVVVLALGIGANTAIFSVVNAVLVRPLPFPESDRLVRLYEKQTDAAVPSERVEVAPANFLDWQRQSRTLPEIAAWGDGEQALANAGQAEPVRAAFVSANFLSVLGVSPSRGRGFTSEDDQPGHGIQIRRGREFTEADRDGAPQVALVNESFAGRFYPNEDPLGQRIIIRNQPQACQIVGVVNDVRHFGPDQDPGPEMYVPYNQFVAGAVPLVVRTKSEPEALAGTVRQEIEAVDHEVAVGKVRTMTQMMSAALAEWRFALLLLGIFAATALLLAAVGIYGVMAYVVTRRINEFGVRMALGAQAQDLMKLVIKQGMTLALVGVAIGLAASFALTRLLRTLLFGVSATDPLTFGVIAALLTGVALLACYIPARRATKVDPLVALR